MTLIRKDLYNDLIAVRTTLLAQLEDVTNQVKETEAQIKLMEDFIAGFDKMQTDLTASIVSLEATASANEESVAKLKAKREDLFSQMDELQDRINKKEVEIKKAQQEEQSKDVIDKLVAELSVLNEQYNSVEKDIASTDNQIKLLKENIEDSHKAIDDSKTQLVENEDKKKSYEEKLPEKKEDLDKQKESLSKVNDEYSDFLAKNQATINAFENQQLRRDANIPKKNLTKAFNRVPANASVKQEADEVMKTVVDDELKPADEAEENQRKEWINAGKEKDVNPDFLNADEARSLAYSNMWSTKIVASQIKKAAENGELSVTVSSLPNNVIYALQEAGYAISMTDVDVDVNSHIIISWENLGTK